MGLGQVIFVDGTTAVGKTSACRSLLANFASRGDVAVLHRDLFEELRGSQYLSGNLEAQQNIAHEALLTVVAASRALVSCGVTVYVDLCFGVLEWKELNHLLNDVEKKFVCLLPRWEEVVFRRTARIREWGDKELQRCPWTHSRNLYDECLLMAKTEIFDEVIDSSDMTADETAAVLAGYLP